jgi:large subunit ribosomal protein L16
MFATQSGILTKQEVEAARRTIRKYTGRKTQICVFVKCCYPVTKKPKQSRMGSGKGKIANLVSHICCGKPLFGVKQKKGLRESGGLRYYRALVKGQTKLSLLTSVRSSLF